MENEFKSGFVSIVGNPNAGKSTLYNALMGMDLSIINRKAQTTRHRILGVDTTPEYQIVYSDTPGVLREVSYKLHEKMMSFVRQVFDDSDILIWLIDAYRSEVNEDTQTRFNNFKGIKTVVVNKADLNQEKATELTQELIQNIPANAHFTISASEKTGLLELKQFIVNNLPPGPLYFPQDQVTDKTERFFVNEFIRNAALTIYAEEVPYAIEVITTQFQETEKLIRIYAEIIAERDSQKIIILGKGGEKIKKMGTLARLDMEKLFNKKVYLNLFVKTRGEWRNNENMLRGFGYSSE